jgi:hypothetical protein
MQKQFLCDCVKWTPDLALLELQMELHDVCGLVNTRGDPRV